MNILILSCGTRNKLIQYFKKELKGEGLVLATDCNPLAPALYEADHFFIVPKIHDELYLKTILTICEQYNVKAVLTLIDPEICLLAKNEEEFLKIGTIPIIPDFKLAEMCFDKYIMGKFLEENDFPIIKSYISIEAFEHDLEKEVIHFPIFVKPIKGSASLNIFKVTSREEVKVLFNKYEEMMIQEYVDGIEYGVDVYIDLLSNEPVAIFIKKKILMRAGETDKSVSIKDPQLFNLIYQFVKKAGFRGVVDIDVFKVNGEYVISEVNPRFGGGYPHAYESGVNIPRMIINNLKGIENEEVIGHYDEGIYMMKYTDVKIYKNIQGQGALEHVHSG